MDRRAFIRALTAGLAGAAAATFDPDRLLWVPGARTFFLPSLNTSPMMLYIRAGDGLTIDGMAGWRIVQSTPFSVTLSSSPYRRMN